MNRTASISITAVACVLGACFGHQLGRDSVPVVVTERVRTEFVSGREHSTEEVLMPSELVGRIVELRKNGDKPAVKAINERFKSLDLEGVKTVLADALAVRNADWRRHVMFTALNRFAELDPEGAIEYLAEEIPERIQFDYAKPVFSTITRNLGGQTAFDLYKKNLPVLEGQVGVSSLFPLFHEWRKQDLAAALVAEAQVEDPSARRQVIYTLTEGATEEKDRERLLPWARELTDERERLLAIGRVAGIWAARESVEVVLAWAEETDLGAKELAAVERDIAGTKLLQDPQAAADWLMSRATESSRSEHLAHIAEKWANRAPNAAGEWLGKQELDAGADQAIAGFARTITRDDPESAFEWAKRIGDETLRERAVENVLSYWKRFDPVAAKRAQLEE